MVAESQGENVEAASPSSAAISVRDVSVLFGSESEGSRLLALDAMNLRIGSGELVCIVGPSGCGKSTFLNAISGLLTDQDHSGGEVTVTGRIEVLGERPGLRDSRIGYLFQRDTLLPWMVAVENVALPLLLAGWQKRDARDRARELLQRAGLEEFAQRYPRDLSGGMRKRIQLLQVLAQDPQVLFMDEPFGALDAQTKVIMQQEFLSAWERDRKTIVFVTHDLNEALLLGDRVVCMTARPGRIKLEVAIPLDRPRSVGSVTSDPRYGSLFAELWHAVEEEANRALRGMRSDE